MRSPGPRVALSPFGLRCWGRTECCMERQNSLMGGAARADRKSTRLNSSHLGISYAVFCLKKKSPERDDPGGAGGHIAGALEPLASAGPAMARRAVALGPDGAGGAGLHRASIVFFLMSRRPPKSSLFPSTPLFR